MRFRNSFERHWLKKSSIAWAKCVCFSDHTWVEGEKASTVVLSFEPAMEERVRVWFEWTRFSSFPLGSVFGKTSQVLRPSPQCERPLGQMPGNRLYFYTPFLTYKVTISNSWVCYDYQKDRCRKKDDVDVIIPLIPYKFLPAALAVWLRDGLECSSWDV